MKYDVVIIGAGVIGANVARELAKYKLNVALLEKNTDVGDETSCANSAIVHSGYDPHAGTLKAKFNVLGNELMEPLCKDLDVEFERIGSITVANNDEELNTLYELKENSALNGVDVQILNQEELRKMEPFVTKTAIAGLYAPTCGIINPFEFVVALCENAVDNGVNLFLNTNVTNIEKVDDSYKVTTDNGEFIGKVVVNAAGLNSDVINNLVMEKKEKVIARKGEYYVLDHFKMPYVSHTLFSVPSSKGKGVLVSPTTHGNFLIGPSSEFGNDKDDVAVDKPTLDNLIKEAHRLVDDLPMYKVIREFAGNRCYHESNDFVINSKDNFINLIGIQSPGFASSPAIGKEVVEMIKGMINCPVNENFNPKRRPLYRVNKLSDEERNALIKKNPDFGYVVCRCEDITLGEIKDAINRNVGARTIKGVKKRVRPGFGKCQGGFCQSIVLKTLCNELNLKPEDIKLNSKGSDIVLESER